MIYLIHFRVPEGQGHQSTSIDKLIDKHATSHHLVYGRASGTTTCLIETEESTSTWFTRLRKFDYLEAMLVIRVTPDYMGHATPTLWTHLKLWCVTGAFKTAAERAADEATTKAATEAAAAAAAGPPPALPLNVAAEVRDLYRLAFTADEIACMAPTFGVDPRSIRAEVERWAKWTANEKKAAEERAPNPNPHAHTA